MAKNGRGGKRGDGRLKDGKLGASFNGERADLVSQRERKINEVDQTLTTLRDMANEYNITVDTYTTSDISDGVLGFMLGDNTITLNNAYFNSDRMNKAMKECANSGFHPSLGDKSGIEAVVAHEFGHIINNTIADKMGLSMEKSAKVINEEARKISKDKGVIKMANKISRYATYSNAETIAEAICDCYCNGTKAKTQSKAIKSVIDKYLKGAN